MISAWVRFWPICELALGLTEVRLSRQSGPNVLNLSSSRFDPEPTSDRPRLR